MTLEDYGTDSDALSASVEVVVEYEAEQAAVRRARIFKQPKAAPPDQELDRVIDFGELVALVAIALESLLHASHSGPDGLKDPRVRERFRSIAGMELSELGPKVNRLEGLLLGGHKPSATDLDVPAAYEEFLHLVRATIESRSFDTMKEKAIDEGNAERAERCHFIASRLRQLVARSDAMNPILKTLGMAYAEGRVSLTELGSATGLAPEDLIPELERLGYHRQLAAIRLSDEERRARLQALAGAKSPPTLDPDHVRRDVIATHRIEGVDARGWLTARP
jgi:hypothetical protein